MGWGCGIRIRTVGTSSVSIHLPVRRSLSFRRPRLRPRPRPLFPFSLSLLFLHESFSRHATRTRTLHPGPGAPSHPPARSHPFIRILPFLFSKSSSSTSIVTMHAKTLLVAAAACAIAHAAPLRLVARREFPPNVPTLPYHDPSNSATARLQRVRSGRARTPRSCSQRASTAGRRRRSRRRTRAISARAPR